MFYDCFWRRVSLLSVPLPWLGTEGLQDSFLRYYLFIFRERGREGERERNITVWLSLARPLLRTWPLTQACAPTENQTSDTLVCRSMLSPLSYTSDSFKKKKIINTVFICLSSVKP